MAHKSNTQVRTGARRAQHSKRLRDIVQYERKLVMLDADCKPVTVWVALPAGFVPDPMRSDVRQAR